MDLCCSRINLDRAALDFTAKQGAATIRLGAGGAASWSLANLRRLGSWVVASKASVAERQGGNKVSGQEGDFGASKYTKVFFFRIPNTPIEVAQSKFYLLQGGRDDFADKIELWIKIG